MMEEVEGQIINFDQICRLCLHEKRTLTEIFDSTTGSNSLTIDKKIMACATVDLCKDDGLPTRICIKCLANLNAAFNFRIQCESSDKTLHRIHNILSEDKSEKEADVIDCNKSLGIVEAGKDEKNENLDSEEVKRKKREISKVKGIWARDMFPICEFLETSLSLKDKRISEKETCLGERILDRTNHWCETCDKTFSVRKSLVRHNLKFHGIETRQRPKVHKCSVCLETFPRWIQLYEHQKTFGHAKEKCKYCDKYFSRKYMSEHVRNHTGEKPFLCNLCGQSFGQISTFYKHRKLCSNAEKKLKCSFCDRRYHERYTLIEHERIHTNEKPFVCEICGKTFRQKGKLHIHQLSHKNLKPHTCSICQRSFRQRGHLTEHLRVHSGVKPYTCGICGAAFTQSHSLKHHKAKHELETINDLIIKNQENGLTVLDGSEDLFYILKKVDDDKRPRETSTEDGVIYPSQSALDNQELQSEEQETCIETLDEISFAVNEDVIQTFAVVVNSSASDKETSFTHVILKDSKSSSKEVKKSSCPFCHKVLARVDEHIRLIHGNRVYACDKHNCGAEFTTLKNLQSHQLRCYDMKKPYKCSKCNKDFHRKSNFKAHVKRHADKKEFQCQFCDRAFVDSTGLKRHLLKHHEPEQEVFTSMCCGKLFKSKEGLKKHIRKSICGVQIYECSNPVPGVVNGTGTESSISSTNMNINSNTLSSNNNENNSGDNENR